MRIKLFVFSALATLVAANPVAITRDDNDGDYGVDGGYGGGGSYGSGSGYGGGEGYGGGGGYGEGYGGGYGGSHGSDGYSGGWGGGDGHDNGGWGGGSSGNCNTGSITCCNSIEDANSASAKSLLDLVGVAIGEVVGQVGISCSPISVLSGGGSSCSASPVCCENNSFNGLVALGCVSIGL